MRPTDDIQRFIDKAAVRTNPKMDETVLNNVLAAQEKTTNEDSAALGPSRRSIIMRRPIVKLAVAAALITVAGLGILEFFGTGKKSGVVWAEVAQRVQASRGVMFRATERIVPDTYDQEVDFSMQHGTSTQSRLDKYKGGKIITTIWGDGNTKTMILVDYYHKSYVRMVLEKTMPGRLGTTDPNNWVQRFLSCQYQELGQKIIDGVLCEGVETRDPAFYGGGEPAEPPVARLWVSVETGYPVRFEGERAYDEARHTFVQDQFRWDVDLDGSLFEPNVPAGYLDISP
jgi:hypothetical protein